MAATAATVASAAATAYSTYEKIKKGADAANKAIGTVSEVVSAINDLKDRATTSLTAYAKQTLITSRVYVEDELATEDITPKLMKLLNQMYSGFILCAVGVSQIVCGGKIVKNMAAAISTENFKSIKDLTDAFGDPEPATEGQDQGGTSISPELEKKMQAESARLFCGHVMEFDVPTEEGKIVPLYFYVQLLPQVIPGVVMTEFLRANASPSLKLRWAMWKAGEIKFWKDFVFECDRVAKRKKALKVDKDGILREMEDKRSAALKKKVAQMKDKATRRRNLCNSIIICTKRSLDNVCKDLGINMKSYAQRDELMNDLMAIMLCVVDPNYGTVDLYMNGIEARGEYNAKMIDAASKSGKDQLDVKEMLTLISAGSMPKF